MNKTFGELFTEKVNAAFREVEAQLIEQARRTNTPIIVWEDGRVVEKYFGMAKEAQERHVEERPDRGDAPGPLSK